MIKKFVFAFGTLALALASAANSYHVTLFQPSLVNGSQLKAGDYKIDVKDNKAVIKQGGVRAEASVKVETLNEKYASTTVKYVNGVIQEIRLGGTHTKLVFEN